MSQPSVATIFMILTMVLCKNKDGYDITLPYYEDFFCDCLYCGRVDMDLNVILHELLALYLNTNNCTAGELFDHL